MISPAKVSVNVVADTHVHIYSCYDFGRAMENLRLNLAAHNETAINMAFLTERHDCHFFKKLKNDGDKVLNSNASLKVFNDSLLIKEKGYRDLYLFSGRQVITAERLEILALTTDVEIPDGLPVREVVQRVNRLGAVAVLSWAPGKWFGERGKLVYKLLSDFSAQEMLLGDTTLRPWCWLEPLLMKKGAQKGFSILAGSDPLPFSGEEIIMGRYCSIWKMEFDFDDPVSSVREYLRNGRISSKRIGQRGSLAETLVRLFKNQRSRK